MKKKTVSILLMAAMALSLAACGSSNSTDFFQQEQLQGREHICIQRFFGSRERIQRQEHSRRRSI